jgi:hypothetical protein
MNRCRNIDPNIDRKSAMKCGGVAGQDFTESELGYSWYRRAMECNYFVNLWPQRIILLAQPEDCRSVHQPSMATEHGNRWTIPAVRVRSEQFQVEEYA